MLSDLENSFSFSMYVLKSVLFSCVMSLETIKVLRTFGSKSLFYFYGSTHSWVHNVKKKEDVECSGILFVIPLKGHSLGDTVNDDDIATRDAVTVTVDGVSGKPVNRDSGVADGIHLCSCSVVVEFE